MAKITLRFHQHRSCVRVKFESDALNVVFGRLHIGQEYPIFSNIVQPANLFCRF